MRLLIVLDPLERLDWQWDTSLSLVTELLRRGHEVWFCDSVDLMQTEKGPWAFAAQFAGGQRVSRQRRLWRLDAFSAILVRKEPPFDLSYVTMTYILESAAEKIPVMNHPRGIRSTNEKFGILRFPKWVPPTLVSADPEKILALQKSLASDLVVKPLDERGGRGVCLLKKSASRGQGLRTLHSLTAKSTRFVMAQKYLGKNGDKRILILDGRVLTAYERRPARGDFRSNLSLGGTFHPAGVSVREQRMVAGLRPYLKGHGLSFVGIDVMKDKLIEINVTCPAGLCEAESLYPRGRFIEAWADYLESFIRRKDR